MLAGCVSNLAQRAQPERTAQGKVYHIRDSISAASLVELARSVDLYMTLAEISPLFISDEENLKAGAKGGGPSWGPAGQRMFILFVGVAN